MPVGVVSLTVESRIRRLWLATLAVAIARRLPAAVGLRLVRRALAFVRPEFRVGERSAWQSLGKLEVSADADGLTVDLVEGA